MGRLTKQWETWVQAGYFKHGRNTWPLFMTPLGLSWSQYLLF